MNWLTASLAAAVVALSFVVGWLTPGAPPSGNASHGLASRSRPPADIRGDAAGAVNDLAAYIADDRPAPPPGGYVGDPPPPAVQGEEASAAAPPPPPEALPPPPPPPPDVGVVFRRQVTGVVNDRGGLTVLLADAGTGQGSRRLRVGDRYDQTWTLVGLSREAALLSDGDRLRRIPFFGGPMTSEGAKRG